MIASTFLAVWSLAKREVVRFLRQRSRATGAFLQPVIFWILFGTGFSSSFRAAGDQSYAEFFLPGIAAMIVMFAAIFSAISVIQDRNEGFLQGVLVSPVPRTAIVLGKLCGGTVLAVLQGLLFLALAAGLQWIGVAPEMAWSLDPASVVGTVAFLALMGFGLVGFGYLFAWKLDSIQGFHAIMSVLLFPMWLLSGAFFPIDGSGWLGWIMRLNPLTYSVAGLKRVMAADPSAVQGLPEMWLCITVSLLFAVVCVLLAARMTKQHQL
jgi:ABC-2 type transport system permease protein